MKGITPIIGIIILLLIVIAISGLAYTFIFGSFTGYTAKTFRIVPGSADDNRVIIQNIGTEPFSTDEISITVGGEDAELLNPQTFEPQESVILEFFPPGLGDNKQVRLTGPTNTETYFTELTFYPVFSCSQDDTGGFWQTGASYKVVNDIIENPGDICFNLDVADITLDCEGKTVSNLGSGNDCIEVLADNIIVRNCLIESDTVGIMVVGDGNILEDNRVDAGGGGIVINGADNTLINNNVCLGSNNVIWATIADAQNPNSRDNTCGQNQCNHGGLPISNICIDGDADFSYDDCNFNC